MPQDAFDHRKPKSWLKITVEGEPLLTEPISSFLANITGGGIEHNNCFTPKSQNQTDSISAYFLEDSKLNKKLERVHAFLKNLATQHPKHTAPVLRTETVIEEDWGSSWKKHFKPFQATERLIIKPSWEECNLRKGQHIIEIDPGMAFGTGLHASTLLALELIDQLFTPGEQIPKSALDVGTGTGILGICCACLGCRKVVAIDNDIDARVAAKNNTLKNRVDNQMVTSDQDLSDLNETYDLVIANIIYNTLIELAEPLTARLAQHGHLILAGILTGSQTEDIISHYSKLGLKTITMRQKDEWSSLCLRLQ